MVCFIALLLSSAAVAYYPFLIVRECPHCKVQFIEEQTVSGNTIGAQHFTDGRVYAPRLPKHPWLAKCPACGGLFWVDETKEVDFGFDAAKGKPHVLAPPEKGIMEFLTGYALPTDKEVYLRMRLWWAANDPWRRVPNPKPEFPKQQEQNLDALAALLDESEPGERILKAELARELGNFKECLRLLSSQFDENYEFAAGFIKKLAEGKVQAAKPFEATK